PGDRPGAPSSEIELVIRVPVVLFFVVQLVVELVVQLVVAVRVLAQIREGAGAFPEQPIVVPLLELARLTEASCSSFSGHVVTCLEVVTPIMPCLTRPGRAEREMAGDPSGRDERRSRPEAMARPRRPRPDRAATPMQPLRRG